MNATITSPDRIAPINGRSNALAAYLDDAVRFHRCQGTPEAEFVAGQLERVAQLIAWTQATSPEQYADRLALWDSQIAEGQFDRGYSEGFEAGLAARRHIS